MKFSKQRLSLEEARQLDMVNYLSLAGYEPAKIRNNDYWYCSPLRDEKTPSFKINRKLNRWYDHGLGSGGNLIDFGILFHNCSVAEFMKKVNSNGSFQKPLNTSSFLIENETESRIKILREKPLSFLLLRYLHQRKIPSEVANNFCKEISYSIDDKTYYGIGFKNDAGGYEIRNPYFKGSSAPKDITTLRNNASAAFVFEGFIDFLSFLTINKNQPVLQSDFVVLNSVALFEKARPFTEQHDTIKLYFDRDTTGQNYSRYALSLSSKYCDESGLYANHKDLNDWLVNFGKTLKEKPTQKLR